MAADPTASQSTWVSKFRGDIAVVLSNLSTLDADRLKAASLGGVDNFVSGAFAGNNSDLVAADVDAAMTSLTTIRALLFDASGNPTPLLLSIAKVAQ